MRPTRSCLNPRCQPRLTDSWKHRDIKMYNQIHICVFHFTFGFLNPSLISPRVAPLESHAARRARRDCFERLHKSSMTAPYLGQCAHWGTEFTHNRGNEFSQCRNWVFSVPELRKLDSGNEFSLEWYPRMILISQFWNYCLEGGRGFGAGLSGTDVFWF